jgi:hypothetical protein
MFGEPEIGESSTFWFWELLGRMFTGLVGVDMSVGMKKRNLTAHVTHVCHNEANWRRIPCLEA